jgi:membrane-bound lytic murein transglycosylase F
MWQRICPKKPDELMQKTAENQLDLLLTDSDQFSRYRYAYPKLRIAFKLPEKTHLAWGILDQKDDSLYLAASNFLQRPRTQRLIERLKDQYHWRMDYPFNYVDIKLFRKAVKTHLPKYLADFQTAGKKHGIDWRLLAAIGYQESHWKRSAKSPTGVRGIMMLTQPTAKEVGVKNRLNPRESIKGGSVYYAHLLSKVPKGISNPNRTLLALAAYNVGLGHVKDAMTIAYELNLPWNSWAHLKMALPLLQQKKWYKNKYVKYGFARGTEAVNYVEKIRHYYDLLKQIQGDGGETAGVTTSSDGGVSYSGGNLPRK